MVTGTHSSHALPSKRGVVLARLNASISALWALLALLLFSALLSLPGLPAARAVPSTIFPDQCYSNFDLLQWDVKRYGPVCIGTCPSAHSVVHSRTHALTLLVHPSPSL